MVMCTDELFTKLMPCLTFTAAGSGFAITHAALPFRGVRVTRTGAKSAAVTSAHETATSRSAAREIRRIAGTLLGGWQTRRGKASVGPRTDSPMSAATFVALDLCLIFACQRATLRVVSRWCTRGYLVGCLGKRGARSSIG